MNRLTVLDQANAIAEAALAILKQWGSNNGTSIEVRTDAGTIQFQRDVIRIGPKFHNWNSDWVSLQGCALRNPEQWEEVTGFEVRSVEGNIDSADRTIVALSLFLVSAPFVSSKKASISRMKRIAAAVMSED